MELIATAFIAATLYLAGDSTLDDCDFKHPYCISDFGAKPDVVNVNIKKGVNQ